jgi:hypothetical protein
MTTIPLSNVLSTDPQKAVSNSNLLQTIANNRKEDTIFNLDGFFPICETFKENENFDLPPLRIRSYDLHSWTPRCGFLMMENKDAVHIHSAGARIGDGGSVHVRHDYSLDANNNKITLREQEKEFTSDIATYVLKNNMGLLPDGVDPEYTLDPIYSTHADFIAYMQANFPDIDILNEPEKWLIMPDGRHKLNTINDTNGRGIVVSAGAFPYGVEVEEDANGNIVPVLDANGYLIPIPTAQHRGNSDPGHISTYRTEINARITYTPGIAIDLQDGSTLQLDISTFGANRGMVIRGGRWDMNHMRIRNLHCSFTELNPIYIEGNGGLFGTGFNNASRFITNSGIAEYIKFYHFGAPAVFNGSFERATIFSEQGAENGNGGPIRSTCRYPLIFTDTAIGCGDVQVMGDQVDPMRIATMSKGGNDWVAGLTYKHSSAGMIAKNKTLEAVRIKDKGSYEAVELTATTSPDGAALNLAPAFSGEGTATIKAASGKHLRLEANAGEIGTIKTNQLSSESSSNISGQTTTMKTSLTSQGVEVELLHDNVEVAKTTISSGNVDSPTVTIDGEAIGSTDPVPGTPPFEPVTTDFATGTLEGWVGVSISNLRVVSDPDGGFYIEGDKTDGSYDRVEFNLTNLTVGQEYIATLQVAVTGSDPRGRVGTWSGAVVADTLVTETAGWQIVTIPFVADDTEVKIRYYIDNDKGTTTDTIKVKHLEAIESV